MEWKTEELGIYDGIGFAAILFIILIVSWLSNRETERSLARARRSEKALRAEKGLLEIKVGTRTEELQQLQMQRITELHHLAEMGRSAGDFFHDLMNPLTGLVLAVERLSIGKAANKRVLSEHLDKALSASRHMEKFIAAIRRHGSIAAMSEALPVRAELDQAIQLLEYKARKNGVNLELAMEGKATPAPAPADFYKIAYNLISYSIDVAAGSAANLDKLVSIKLACRSSIITLIITYPGSAMPDQDQRAPADAKMLGVTIAKNLLEKIGGSISIGRNAGKTSVVIKASFPQH